MKIQVKFKKIKIHSNVEMKRVIVDAIHQAHNPVLAWQCIFLSIKYVMRLCVCVNVCPSFGTWSS